MHPRLGRVLLVLGALFFTLSAAALAQVDSHARIVRLSFVQGEVQMDRPGADGLDTAFLNMPMVEGSRLVTGDDGFAEVEFEDRGTIRLTPGSEMNFRQLGLRGDNKVSLLDLAHGTAYFNVRKDNDDDFRVLVNGQEMRVPKSSRFRIRLTGDSAEIAVTKGELELTGGEHDVRVKKDETLTLDFHDRGRYFLAKNVTPLSFDTWDHERDDYRERYLATSNSYRGYSSNYSYGVSDLNYYGNYIYMPGYGYVWRPYGFDASWDPFSDGAWVWYPGYGYTWVSGYPWGWMPYRYGRWVYAAGYGWVWQPGNSWNRWYTCSAVYNPPRYYRPPSPPVHRGGGGGHNGGGGHVVVVGKGPFNGHPPDQRRPISDDGRDFKKGAGGGPVGAPVAGSGGATPPAALTPGVQPDRTKVIEALRRVHGDDLGLPARVRERIQTSAD